MLCQNCNENEANVRYTQIINGVKKQMNLCERCAKKLGIDDISFNMPIDFSNFLGDMFDYTEEFMPSLIKPQTLICDDCKMSYEDFVQNGKFGCEHCYDVFKPRIDAILKNIHGVNRHVGRNGKMIGEKIEKIKDEGSTVNKKEEEKDDKLKILQERLKKEVKEERYEDAAKTRDEIKKLNS